MLPGRIHVSPDDKVMEFSIEKSSGRGKMQAFDKQTGEKFTGNYSAYYSGQNARGEGMLIGDRGKKIKLRLLIEPGIRPTGRGTGSDGSGKRYDIVF
ncbi:hypothetical protein SAMN06298226_2748 [Nitrosovibrio sp. Nv4]|nr:hypothetical protein SAMN06298226_2748 [Nitrosovibrio sp. Nv4]